MQSKKSRLPKRKLAITSIVIFLCVVVGLGFFFLQNSDTNSAEPVKSSNSNSTNIPPSDKYPNRIRLIASGDVVAHDSVNVNAEQADGSYDYFPMMDNMVSIFSGADIDFCNQVTPAGGTEFGVKGYPKFNAPTELVRDLGKVGCNTVNMASNHSFDVSQEAIDANVEAWENVPNMLAFAGQNRSSEERDTVKYFDQKGVKFAFLAYTTYVNSSAPAQNQYGVTQYSRELATKQIAAAKSNGADVIITSMRWGTEYSDEINAQQNSEAQFLADQGVALVLGHGPHVLQPVKKLQGREGNDTYVWFSLGNFLNTQLEAEALFNGFAIIDFDTVSKKVTNVAYLPIYMYYEWSAADAAQENLLARRNLELFLLEDTSQAMIDSQHLKTTVSAQKERITTILNTHIEIPLIDKATYNR